jgi:hypothetical protein
MPLYGIGSDVRNKCLQERGSSEIEDIWNQEIRCHFRDELLGKSWDLPPGYMERFIFIGAAKWLRMNLKFSGQTRPRSRFRSVNLLRLDISSVIPCLFYNLIPSSYFTPFIVQFCSNYKGFVKSTTEAARR